MQPEHFLINFLLAYLTVVNIVSFSLMRLDKKRSRDQKYRISEKQLFAWVTIGGSLGGFMGMYVFKHKTKHPQFKFGFSLILFFHLVMIGFLGFRVLPLT
jgi:uncharacterized membrane protein YsdA (DUF1294 family)